MKTSYNLEEVLTQLGLSHSERTVYLAGYDISGLTSSQLIKITKLPRPTVMAAIKTLRDYGLCQVRKRDGRSLVYKMQSPSGAKSIIGSKMRELDELGQVLDQLSRAESGITSVKEANNQEELKDLLELALRCQSRQWQIIAPRDNALAYMPKQYVVYFKRTRQERHIESQTLWDGQWKGKPISLNDVLMRKPRYISGSLAKKIPCLLLAFDDKLLTIEGTTEPTAVLVQSQATSDTYKLIFDLAWRASR